jgi:isopropylmalate/homocitrate/citramalate synthase
LSIRCEQLGYQFDRRELDDVYRRFVQLADTIKHVEDHHVLQLIRETHRRSVPAAASAVAAHAAASAPATIPAKIFAAAAPTNPFGMPAQGHTQQEDYLWGV